MNLESTGVGHGGLVEWQLLEFALVGGVADVVHDSDVDQLDLLQFESARNFERFRKFSNFWEFEPR